MPDLQESARSLADVESIDDAVESRPYQPHPAPALMWRIDRQDTLTTEGTTMGDIGPVRREITFEPMPDDVPVETPVQAPVEPEKVPA